MPELNHATPQSAQMPKILTSRWFQILPAVLVLLTSVMPIFFLYAQNSYNIDFAEILLPMAAAAVLGLVVYFIALLIFRNSALTGLLAALCMFLFMNFNLVLFVAKKIMPLRPVIMGYAIAAAVACVALVVLILLRKKQVLLRAVVGVLVAVLAVQVLANAITAVPAAYRKLKDNAQSDTPPVVTEQTLPNIYYLVTDEYFDFDLIKQYYDFDNTEFYDFLVDSGFSVSTTSYNNTSDTMPNLADILNLEYLSGSLTEEQAQSAVANAKLFDILRQQGYSVGSATSIESFYPLEPLYELDRFAFQAGSATTDGTGTLELILKNTMLNPFSEIVLLTLSGGSSPVVRVFDYMQNEHDYTAGGNNAVFMYVCAPHVPFQLNADGSMQPMDDWSNWSNPECYLEQFKYITGQLTETIKTIMTKDPDSIIILQSDHGVRYHLDCELTMKFEIAEDDERRILNAVYYCGQPLDVQGASGVNTWRRVLTRIGLYYPDVEVPNPITIEEPQGSDVAGG